jgi:hypothetical protein
LAFTAFKTNALGNMLRKALQKSLEDYLRRTAPPEYHDLLIPEFDFGAKRPVLGHGYLSTLHDPRVTLVRSPSLTVTGPHTMQAEDSLTFQVDVIILANSFRTQELLTPMIITGTNGAKLPDLWRQEENFASAYMG